MKTVTVKFHEYSKEYDFTAPDFINTDDFVLVYTLEEFKIVRVVDTNNSVDAKNKEIVAKVDVNTDNIRVLNHFTRIEVVKYRDNFYNIPIFMRQYHDDWELLAIANAFLNKQKTFYVIECECFEARLKYRPKYSYYKSSTLFEKDLVKIDVEKLSEEESEKFLKNLSEDDFKKINFENKPELVEHLSQFETSFIKNDSDFYKYHPVRAICSDLRDNYENLRILTSDIEDTNIFSEAENEVELYDVENICKTHKHYDELLEFSANLQDEIEEKIDRINDAGYSYYPTKKDYIEDVEYYDDEYCDSYNSRVKQSLFNIICFNEINIEENYTEIEPVLKFHISHVRNFIANMFDIGMKYQQIDIKL